MTSGPNRNRNQVGAVPRYFRAPGRINIIGEHTDYNDGLVLPINTALYTTVAATPRRDSLIRVVTKTLDDAGEFRIDTNRASGPSNWLAYVKGVAAELSAAGVPLSGANLCIESDIPIGGGLSSSASLELAVARALVGLAGVDVEPTKLALACQRAEIEFAGVNCGIMDQFSVACGRPGAAMLLDCKDLHTEFAALPEDVSLVITDSGVEHQHPASGYNDRARECTLAVAALREAACKIQSLRDASPDLLETNKSKLGDVLYRRARHVITENARTLAAFAKLKEGDVAGLGALIDSSHKSLRDDYEVSCDGIEILINLVTACEGVAGSRMVGGGFGGCVLSVVDTQATDSVVDRIKTDYANVIGQAPWVHVVAPAQPAREVERR